jgi:mRNA-degrading endonuclease RelE of RelBE toxin-antitoxin system
MEIIFSHTAKNNIQKLQKNDQEYIKEKILFLSKLENIFNYPKIKKLESLQFYRFRT